MLETAVAPAAQLAHALPPKLYVLPLQAALQPAAVKRPGFVIAPAKPGAQTVHAATAVLPVASVETPVGQLVHEAAPAAAYWPAGQAAQPAALAEPPPETVPAKPGAQMVQAETDVLPSAEPVV